MAAYLRRDEEELGRDGMEDMINLLSLTEENILKNLQIRYDKELIYTYTGSILVAVNPYKMFNMYGLEMVRRYEDQTLGTQAPHLFAIGSASFGKMNKDSENQVIIISGESGAGKTESTKLLMQYLAAVNKSGTNIVTERILETNPLLESFGNAKTIKNDNSSRFGKYVELYFKGKPRGSIVGANTSEYLLEKSRIVTQAADERNYHVFYEMLAGLSEEERLKYGLTAPEKYFYLNQGGSPVIPLKNDAKDYKDLRAAIEVLGFKHQEKETIYKILAAVLHLGNIYFQNAPDEYQHDAVAIAPDNSETEVKWVCHLLQLDEDWLRESLTKRVTEARQERMLTPLNNLQAQDARDAIAKALYSRLFSWLVERINQIVKGPEQSGASRDKIISIAILDIFGFEDFRLNSFEQLCINYANESLQFYFNKHIFKLEQAEYTREHINWTSISFHDNQPTIDLIAKKPLGIIHLLDDESNFPKGTDQSFLDKCHFNLSNNALYEKPRMSGPEFSIKHYAGKVTYNVRNFLDKNRDTLRGDVVQLMIQSKNDMISNMFRELRDRVVTKTISKMSGLYVTMKPKTPTVAAGFHESLGILIENMAKCNPWFVRCIKPNNHKAAMLFEREVVLQQLRYTGMLETIKIRKMGYPFRHRFNQFATKYYVLLPHRQRSQTARDDRVTCERVLRVLGQEWDNDWQLGISKVFLKERLSYDLDRRKQELVSGAVLRLQKYSRGYIARKRYSKIWDASVIIQAAIRAKLQRTRYVALRQGIVQAQAQYRMHLQRKRYTDMLVHQKHEKEEEIRRHREEIRVEEARMLHGRIPSERKRIYDGTMPNVSNRVSAIEQDFKRARTEMPGQQTVAQLEIPRELANVFRTMERHYPPHTEEHNIVRSRDTQPINLNLSLPPDIDAHAFSKFANVYFQDQTWRMKKEPITKPFLKDSDSREALAIFKLIMRYMHDSTQSKRQQRVIADYIVQTGIRHDNMRDEIFVQLCTQTWLNKDDNSRVRGWVLMANCLSCFQPSKKLSKYLLKYVSDHGLREYKEFCQFKLLQSLCLEDDECRTYPPSLLEWKAAEETACMALNGVFSDRVSKMAHVESWTTAEEFASYLLQTRGIKEGHHGWTLLLREDNESYEYAGYDYVLDHITEMELETGFPHSRSYYLTTVEKSREGSSARRDPSRQHPHIADEARILFLPDLGITELLKPIAVEPRSGPDPQAFFKYNSLSSDGGIDSNYSSTEDLLSPGSKLNVRNALPDENLSPSSYLNIRYISGNKKRVAPAPPGSEASESTLTPTSPGASSPPPMVNGHHTPNSQVHIAAHSKLNRRYMKSSEKNPDLADTKLNDRYGSPPMVNGGLTNGEVGNGHMINGHMGNGDIPDHRFKKKQPTPAAANPVDHNAKDRINRVNRTNRYSTDGSDVQSLRSEGVDHMIDRMFDFDPMLSSNVDDLSDPRALEGKIKGGGDQPAYHATLLSSGYTVSNPNLPGVQVPGALPNMFATSIPISPQLNTAPVVNPGASFLQQTPSTSVLSPTLPSQISVVPLGVPTQPDPVQQFAAQQLAAQQAAAQQQVAQQQAAQQLAAQQAAAQQAAQQQAAQQIQQQQHLANQRKQSEQLQQQTAQLHVQLQAQQLQTQILQQSLQGEILKRQLKELQDDDEVFQPTSVTSPTISPREGVSGKSQKKHSPRPAKKVPAQGEIDARRPGGVQTLTRSFESKTQVTEDHFRPPDDDHSSTSGSGLAVGKEVKFSERVQTIPTPSYKDRPNSSSLSELSSTSTMPSTPETPKTPPAPPQLLPKPKAVDPLKQQASPPEVAPTIQKVVESHDKPDGTPPPAPPPPPPPVMENKLGKGKFIDGKGTIRVVRIGKIQWPPPVEEVVKSQPQVGRLVIQESKTDEEGAKTGKSADIHRKINEMIQQARIQNDAEPPVPKPVRKWEQKKPVAESIAVTKAHVQEPPKPDINMRERQEVLERQLTQILNKKDVKEEVETLPPPPPIPLPTPSPPPQQPPKVNKVETVAIVEQRRPEPIKIKPVAPVVPPLEIEEPETPVDISALERVKTRLFAQRTGPFYTYSKVPWSLEVRKELFTPNEKPESLDPMIRNLVYIQIVLDVYSQSCIRIMKDDRIKAKNMLESYGVSPRTVITDADDKLEVKKRVVEAAWDWPCYFSRIFAASGGTRMSKLHYVAVSHSGVYLLTREKDIVEDRLKVLEQYRFENIVNVSIPQPYTVQLSVSSYRHVFIYTHKPKQLRSLIDAFCIECEQTEMYVRAIRSYQTREVTLLNFEKGDIIKLTNKNMTLDRGWLYGSVHGRAGYFPKEHIVSMPKHEFERIKSLERPVSGHGPPVLRQPSRRNKVLSPKEPHLPEIIEDEEMGIFANGHGDIRFVNGIDDDEDSRSVSSVNSFQIEGGTFTMLEFAMKYFRKSPYRYIMARGEGGSIHGTFKEISSLKVRTLEKQRKRGSGQDWTWKEQVEMIKWTRSPIQISLLEHTNQELNKLALECFIHIMRYMGDYPLARDQRPVDCVLYILMQLHNHEHIIDEVYCQLIKQTTNNRSTKSDSETMGWRLFAILTAFFDVSDILQPYMQKYLETVAYDSNRPQQALANLCLENLRKTSKFGGRKNVPSKMELDAISRGRISKRQVCVLPGGAPVILNVKSTNVVLDIIDQICQNLGVLDPLEREEYTAFYVIEKENQYCPLNRGEYIFDITTELVNQKKEFYILFQRTSWLFPLRLDAKNQMYLDVMYHQCIPDYLDGFLLPVPSKSLPTHVKDEIAMLGALQLRVMGKKGTPVQKEVASVVPKNVQNLSDMKINQWTNQIYNKLFEVFSLPPEEAKFKFLEKLMKWPLFGSTFFNIKGVTDPRVHGEARLAINKQGVSFLHTKTHETLANYPLQQIISTRRVTTEKNIRLLDVKIGDLMQQKVIRIETDQGADIGSLVSQYIMVMQAMKNAR